jgi:hypothetical protein
MLKDKNLSYFIKIHMKLNTISLIMCSLVIASNMYLEINCSTEEI